MKFLRQHPYKVTFNAGRDPGHRLIAWVMACTSAEAGRTVVLPEGYGDCRVSVVSARKQNMSKCAFYKKFGKAATEAYFGVKL